MTSPAYRTLCLTQLEIPRRKRILVVLSLLEDDYESD